MGRAVSLYCWMAPAGIDVLRADLVHSPTKVHSQIAVVLGEDLQALLRALVPRVQVVALGQGDGRRPEKLGSSP